MEGDQPRGDLARWSSQARQAHCLVGRQFDSRSMARRISPSPTEPARPLQGPAAGPPSGSTATTPTPSAAALSRARQSKASLAHRLPHHDRVRRPYQGGKPRPPHGAGARRRRDRRRRAERLGLALSALRRAGGDPRGMACGRAARRRQRGTVAAAPARPPRPRRAPNSCAARGGTLPAGFRRHDRAGAREIRRRFPQAGDAAMLEPGDRGNRPGDAGAAWRLGRPHRLQPDQGENRRKNR